MNEREAEIKKSATSHMESAFTQGREAGINDGEIDEAMRSLKLRFTDRELDALCIIMWFSERMKSIRNRLNKLEQVK